MDDKLKYLHSLHVNRISDASKIGPKVRGYLNESAQDFRLASKLVEAIVEYGAKPPLPKSYGQLISDLVEDRRKRVQEKRVKAKIKKRERLVFRPQQV